MFRVFPLSIFEVDASSNVPRDKTELQELLRTGKAIPFHKRVCPSCHGVPMSKEWMAANETDGKFTVFISIEVDTSIFFFNNFRNGYFSHWQTCWLFCPLGTNLYRNT